MTWPTTHDQCRDVQATAGTTYYFVVDGYNGGWGVATGSAITLNLAETLAR